MRYAVILAGGSGTRLWPLSRKGLPKQLIPIRDGKSLLEMALERLEGLIPPGGRYVCALEEHRGAVARRLPELPAERFLGEPEGRDTLAAVGFALSVIARGEPEAAVGVFSADHLIRPVESFREIVREGYAMVERDAATLVTFGIAPTHPATGYGYLELAEGLGRGARRVSRFREKPDAQSASRFFAAGAERYLWNAGMFVFRASTFLSLLARCEPACAEGMARVARAWGGAEARGVLAEVYASLRKVSFDVGIMERASADPAVRIASLPLSLEWMDVGSWPAFAASLETDENGNAAAAERRLLEGCRGSLVVSEDPAHLVALIGCEGLVVVHTERATLVCPKDRAEEVKHLHALVEERFGGGYV